MLNAENSPISSRIYFQLSETSEGLSCFLLLRSSSESISNSSSYSQGIFCWKNRKIVVNALKLTTYLMRTGSSWLRLGILYFVLDYVQCYSEGSVHLLLHFTGKFEALSVHFICLYIICWLFPNLRIFLLIFLKEKVL